MNAYELADEAYKKATTRFDYDVALTMKQLIQENSQQADRIAELEKQGSSIWDSTRRVYENCQCDSCKNKIAELEKEIEECWCGGHSYAYLRAKNRLPQTKPLSNDEIREIGDDCELKNNGILNWIDFARTIEERHGIK